MSLTILHYPDPLLKKMSRPIEKITEDHKILAEEMAKAMYRAEGIGLAGPQVGRLERIIVVDVSGPEARESLMVLINPVLTPDLEAGRCVGEEGCLSVPEYRSNVKRHAKVHVQALDLEGNAVEFDAENLLAVCLQHEVDHLDGKLFIDHISRLKRSLYEGRLKKQMKG